MGKYRTGHETVTVICLTIAVRRMLLISEVVAEVRILFLIILFIICALEELFLKLTILEIQSDTFYEY